MNADPAVQLRLLDLQAIDTTLAQLDHRARNLPEAARLADVEARLRVLRDKVVAAQTIVADLERDQAKADADVEQVRERVARDQRLLDSGGIGSARQLEDLQHELASLARRQTELEDIELDLMERLDGAQQAVSSLVNDRDAATADLADATAARDAAVADLERERDRVGSARGGVAADIPADVHALYDRLRADNGGVGAAALRRGRCEGCHMELTVTDLGRIRAEPADAIVRCEECRRILVRTPESGLSGRPAAD
ncbi:MAG: hypothetical protein EPO13_08165 [Actinomycetota bacterium]|nr:MAG: hypothetical protein EPO13_08165 [Actinomycetota bacterium]